MKKNNNRLAAFALAAALAALPRAAGAVVIRPNAASSPAGTVPSNVNYQGRLVDNGFPVTGFRNVTFRIYDALTGPVNLLQTIGPQQVSINQGLFSTTIAISTQALAGPLQKFLEVQVGAQVLSPREQLNSVPYALVAKSLEENLAISTVSVGTQLISSGTLAVASIQALNNSTYFSIISNAHMSSSTLTLDGNAATALTTVGNVGIGTANPGSKLNVSSGTVIVDGNAATALVLDNSASLPVLRFREAGTDKGTIKSVSGSVVIDGDVAGSHDVLINTNSSGNVGVGAAIPGTKFDVAGNAQFGNAGTKTQISALGAITTASGIGTTMFSSNGNMVVGGSVTASAFVGDATGLTNVVRKNGDSMTGPLTMVNSTITVGGAAFSVSATTFVVTGGNVGINQTAATVAAAPTRLLAGGSISANGADQNFAAGGNRTLIDFAGGWGRIQAVQGGGAGISGLQVQDIYFKSGATYLTGFGTSNPTQKIHVSSGTILVDGNTAASIVTSGSVGVGTSLTLGNPLSTQYGGSGQNWSAVAQGALPYFSAAGSMNTLAAGAAGRVLQTNGAGADPSWVPVSGLTAGTASNLAGGSAGVLPFQTALNSTSFTTAGSAGQVLTSNGAVAGGPGWTTATNANTASAIVQRDASNNFSAGTITAALSGNATTATSIAAGAANQIPYQSGAGATTFVAAPGANSVLWANSGAPSWTNAPTFAGTNLTGTASSLNIGGNAATATSATSATSAGTATIGTGINFNVRATIKAIVPSAKGLLYLCTDCAPARIVVSTGTANAGDWADAMGNAF